MFKTGIYKLEQLEHGCATSLLGSHRKVSATLLSAVRAEPETASRHFDRIMHDLNDDRGTYKRTYDSRFEIFDDQCIETLRDRHRAPSLSVHDAAVSSAETAVNFFGKLSQAFPDLSYQASDYDPYLAVLRKGRVRVCLSSSHTVLEVLYPPFVFTPQKPENPWIYAGNRVLASLLESSVVRKLVSAYREGQLPEDQIEQIDLFCPAARALEQTDDRFELTQWNILEPPGESFDCIRAMNVLNPTYFSEEQFRQIVANMHGALTDDGCLITGSNEQADSDVGGAIYQKNGDGFEIAWETGTRPHVHDYVVNFGAR